MKLQGAVTHYAPARDWTATTFCGYLVARVQHTNNASAVTCQRCRKKLDLP